MRFAAVFVLALAAAPAFAQQMPGTQASDPSAYLGENYRGQPFVFDLLARMEPLKEGKRVRFLKEEHRAICAAEMNQSLRLEGLADKARQVYRDCADRLAEAQRHGEVIRPPPPPSLIIPLKEKQ